VTGAARVVRVASAALLGAALAAGCSTGAPDYQTVWSTPKAAPSSSAEPTTTSAPVPIAAYLEQNGVKGTPVAPDKLTDLRVTMPMPPSWHPYQNTNLAPGTRMIAKGDTYPTAMLMVFRLDGDFNVADALTHANGDALVSQNFRQLNASTADFGGFPSSMIEGSYDLNGDRMHSYNRIVIATGSPEGAPPRTQRYLIQFTVTGYADKAVADSDDVEAVIKGFTVSAPVTPAR
jgi:hypothetical protein